MSVAEHETTLTTLAESGETTASAGRSPALVLALELARPAAGGVRWCLAGIDTVALGRGRKRRWSRAERTLEVSLPDRHMSNQHAVISRALGRWIVTDRGSKNGLIVNGAQVDRATLQDGDVIELGRCLLVYRSSMAVASDREAPDDLELPAMQTLVPELDHELAKLRDIATSNVPIMIGGETGTGKEVAARAVHRLSGRNGTLVAVNCGALPANLVESELFGHVKGAFSGATEARTGSVRSAHGGTLLLDEVGDLPLPSQAAFLRFLQEAEVVPVGASEPIAVDARVVSATHRDLAAMARKGEFREDLLARLTGYRIVLPPLRDRREDLGALIALLLHRLAGDRADKVRLSREAARALFAYDWPLNVRQLERALAAALALSRSSVIELDHLPAEVRAGPRGPTDDARELGLSDDDLERRARIVALLEEHAGNISAVGRAMGKARVQVHRWIKRYRIDLDRFR